MKANILLSSVVILSMISIQSFAPPLDGFKAISGHQTTGSGIAGQNGVHTIVGNYKCAIHTRFYKDKATFTKGKNFKVGFDPEGVNKTFNNKVKINIKRSLGKSNQPRLIVSVRKVRDDSVVSETTFIEPTPVSLWLMGRGLLLLCNYPGEARYTPDPKALGGTRIVQTNPFVTAQEAFQRSGARKSMLEAKALSTLEKVLAAHELVKSFRGLEGEASDALLLSMLKANKIKNAKRIARSRADIPLARLPHSDEQALFGLEDDEIFIMAVNGIVSQLSFSEKDKEIIRQYLKSIRSSYPLGPLHGEMMRLWTPPEVDVIETLREWRRKEAEKLP